MKEEDQTVYQQQDVTLYFDKIMYNELRQTLGLQNIYHINHMLEPRGLSCPACLSNCIVDYRDYYTLVSNKVGVQV